MSSDDTNIVKIFNDDESSENTTWSMEDVKDYVKQFMTYELQIRDLQESRREWSKDFLDSKSIPKKELTQALRAAKQDLDIEIIHEIFNTIKTMV